MVKGLLSSPCSVNVVMKETQNTLRALLASIQNLMNKEPTPQAPSLNQKPLVLEHEIADYETGYVVVGHGEKSATPSVEEVEKLIDDFSKIMTDFPRAWEVCKKAGAREEHHEKCSWRTHQMLCDCAASQAFLYSIDNFVTPYQKIVPYLRSLQARNKELEAQAKRIEELEKENKEVRRVLGEPTLNAKIMGQHFVMQKEHAAMKEALKEYASGCADCGAYHKGNLAEVTIASLKS